MATDERAAPDASLTDALLGRPGHRLRALPPDRVESLLQEIWSRASRVWPHLQATAGQFVRFVEERIEAGHPDLAEHVRSLHVEDLYLVLASAGGERAALAELDGRLQREVAKAVHRLDPSPAFSDEVAQQVRQRLLVAGPGDQPKLLEYAGRGPLDGWLHSVAVRIALNLRRRPGPEIPVPPDELPDAPGLFNPEMQLIKAHHQTEFNAAFREALATLTSRERTVLRMRICENLSADRIGAFYGVHRITVARWIGTARERIMERVRTRMTQRLHLDPGEAEGVVGALRSQLDVSISWVWRDEAVAAPPAAAKSPVDEQG